MPLRFRPVDSTFYDLISESARNLVGGAELLAEMFSSTSDRKDIAKKMRQAEHDCDETTHAIIRRVNNGEYLINDKVFARPAVASRVLKEFRELAVYGQEAAPIFAPLSPREVEILDNIAKGMTNKQVAYALSISEQTVKNHMSSILRKLSVNDRTQAVVYAMKQGWIRIPED